MLSNSNAIGPVVNPSRPVIRIGVCVDPTAKNIVAATTANTDILISYHPWQGEAEELLRKHGMSILALHTAWENSPEGVNFTFAKGIGLTGFRIVDGILLGEAGTSLRELLERCQRVLEMNVLSYFGELNSRVNQVGIWAGPGFLPHFKSIWENCRRYGCDTILSSELTLLPLRYASLHGLNLIDLGHSAIAKPGMLRLVQLLAEQLAEFGVTVEFFADFYESNCYTTRCSKEQFEVEESLALFSVNDK